MRIRITERQMGLLREAMSVGPEGELNITSGGMDNIIGKKIGDVFGSIKGVNIISDKVIAYSKFFESNGSSFSAIRNAEEYLDSEGYDKGSMYMDYPIAFMKAGKTGVDDGGSTMITTKHGEKRPLVITKYDRLSRENWDEMDGAMLVDPENPDFRDGNVYVIFFNFPD
jgi:hypothetical protein